MLENFLKLPIREKLFLVIFLSTVLISLPGFFTLLYVTVKNSQLESMRHTQSEMKVLTQDLAKIIISADEDVAADVVAKLHFFPSIFNLFLYDSEGLLVFQHEKSPSVSMYPPVYSKINKDGVVEFGKETFSMFLPVDYMGKTFGSVFLRLSTSHYDEALSGLYKAVVLIIPVMLLASYLLAWWLHRYFSGPITVLSERIREIAEKRNFHEDISSVDGGEIGDLYLSVGQLLETVNATQQRLQESEMSLEAMINVAGSALISIDEDQRITLFNRQAEQLFGYSARDVLGHSLNMLLPEQFREAHQKHIAEFSKKNIQKRMALDRPDVFGLRKNGEVFPVEASISQIVLGNKKIFTVALTDVTQRRQTERELEAYRSHLEEVVEGRTNELREKNSELEAFSYSVAHDLRAPLRSITSFSQILLEESAEKLSEEELDNLSRVVRAGQHMAELIDGILDLARIGRSQISQADVDLSVLATQAKKRLSQDDPQRKVVWDIQPGLVVRGDAQLLGMMMNNLINNAWKYTSKKPQAKISFGVLNQRGKKVFYVRDNGAGFDMKHAQDLFSVFRRLHRAEDYEGTGVGLATVKRIVHRHGGMIWAEAAVGEGAAFYFTIP
jgi:PAS domain S-box-containing protein